MDQEFPFEHFFKKSGQTQSNNTQNKLNNEELLRNFLPIQSKTEKKEEIPEVSLPKNNNDNKDIKNINKLMHRKLANIVGVDKYNAYIRDNLTLAQIAGKNITIHMPSPFLKNMVTGQFQDTIVAAIGMVLESEVVVNFIVNEETFNENTEHESTAKEASFTLELNQTQDDLKSQVESQYLEHINEKVSGSQAIDPHKTFDNFIVGPSNNLAFATTHAVANAPGKRGKYPSLFIYSDSGLGKTHLLHAVANRIKEKFPEQSICLISAREFMKELIESYKDKTLSDFQRKYSESIDVLMIDDIHELKNKQATQEEFFHIFNGLHSKGKQLIFTSDKAPQEINGIEERLMTRLQWGLVIDIQKPDLETRIAILKKKAIELDLFLPHDVLNLIASSIKSSIRELEGSLIKLSATADLTNVEIDTDMAKEILKLAPNDDATPATLEGIAKSTSQYFKVTLADIRSKSRNKEIVRARHISWYLSKHLIDATLKEIAKYYGGRDHSSVIHGVNRVTVQIRTDMALSKDITFIENNL
jgi:chromosomal replication initiator protein